MLDLLCTLDVCEEIKYSYLYSEMHLAFVYITASIVNFLRNAHNNLPIAHQSVMSIMVSTGNIVVSILENIHPSLKLTIDTPYPSLSSELCGIFCEYLRKESTMFHIWRFNVRSEALLQYKDVLPV